MSPDSRDPQLDLVGLLARTAPRVMDAEPPATAALFLRTLSRQVAELPQAPPRAFIVQCLDAALRSPAAEPVDDAVGQAMTALVDAFARHHSPWDETDRHVGWGWEVGDWVIWGQVRHAGVLDALLAHADAPDAQRLATRKRNKTTDQDSRTWLGWAASLTGAARAQGRAVVSRLLAAGVDPAAPVTRSGLSALAFATQGSFLQLLQAGAPGVIGPEHLPVPLVQWITADLIEHPETPRAHAIIQGFGEALRTLDAADQTTVSEALVRRVVAVARSPKQWPTKVELIKKMADLEGLELTRLRPLLAKSALFPKSLDEFRALSQKEKAAAALFDPPWPELSTCSAHPDIPDAAWCAAARALAFHRHPEVLPDGLVPHIERVLDILPPGPTLWRLVAAHRPLCEPANWAALAHRAVSRTLDALVDPGHKHHRLALDATADRGCGWESMLGLVCKEMSAQLNPQGQVLLAHPHPDTLRLGLAALLLSTDSRHVNRAVHWLERWQRLAQAEDWPASHHPWQGELSRVADSPAFTDRLSEPLQATLRELRMDARLPATTGSLLSRTRM